MEFAGQIMNTEHLLEHFPYIHRVIASQTTNPASPIIAERDIEIELCLREQEHAMENGLDSEFPGMPAEVVNLTIAYAITTEDIADIDGRGHRNNPRPPKSKPCPHFKKLLESMMDRSNRHINQHQQVQ